jgi:hypothetical protein
MNGSIRRRDSRRSSRQSEQPEQDPKPKGKLITTEDSAVGSVSWAVYLRYFKSVGMGFVFLVILFNIISQTSSIGSNCKEIEMKIFAIIYNIFYS